MLNKRLDPDGFRLPRLAELGPQIGAEVNRLDALPIAALATEVMRRAFTPDYIPGGSVTGLNEVADCFLPEHGAPRAGDVTTPAELALRDLIAEGIQVLEQARLVRPKFGYEGWVTTRLGRWALESGNVEGAVARVTG